MKTRQLGCTLLLVFLSFASIIAQTNLEKLVQEGVAYHDAGDYDEAIKMYKQALKLDPQSSLANYEMSLTYFSKGEYKKVIKYADAVLKQNTDFLLQAYMTKGSALDLLGKTKESIKLFKTAINNHGGHYLLHYNLALNYYKLGEYQEAEDNILKGLEDNKNHPSSHFMLANIHNQKGNAVQTLLASYFFLFLEPNTQRSRDALQMLEENFAGNVSKDENKENTINVLLSADNDSQFGAAELMISMLAASKYIEENTDKSEVNLFEEKTESFFNIMGELNKEGNKEIWWDFYTTFFYDLAQSEHLESFCKYITQHNNENAQQWLEDNEAKLIAFEKWLANN